MFKAPKPKDVEMEPWRIRARKHLWRGADGNIYWVCQRCGIEYAEVVRGD